MVEDDHFFANLFEGGSAALGVLTPGGTVTYLSPAAARLLGGSRAEFEGRSLLDLVDPDEGPRITAYLGEVMSRDRHASVYLPVSVIHDDGAARRFELTATNLLDDPAVQGIALNLIDVTTYIQREEMMRAQATRDPLTGLSNRAGLLERLRSVLAGLSDEADHAVALLIVDLDRFKLINDSYGHSVGDEVLLQVADRLLAAVRPEDLVARFGGDEFTVLIEATDRDGAVGVAERMLAAFAAPFHVGEFELVVGASVGVATTAMATTESELLQQADVAQYRAKNEGQGRWCVYDMDLERWVIERKAELADLEFRYRRIAEDNRTLREAVRTDALTGIPNRRALDEAAAGLDERARTTGRPYSIAFIDVDHFSGFNSMYGQQRGDEVLRSVAETINASCRGADRAFRRGGEEFVVALPGTSAVEAASVAERIRAAVEAGAARAVGIGEPVTVSIGVAQLHAYTTPNWRTVEAAADRAMREAKHTGRNRVVVDFPPPEDADGQGRLFG